MGFHESFESDVRELLKTSAKSLANGDLAELEQSTTGEKLSKKGVIGYYKECDIAIKGLREASGEREETLALSKT